MTNNLINTANEVVRKHWNFLGSEIQYSDGIRAIAVAKAIERGVTDLNDLYGLCEIDIGKDHLHRDFDGDEMDWVQRSGWSALHVYLTLYQYFGADWIILGAEAYFECDAGAEDPLFAAHDCVKQALAHYAEFKERDRDAVERWLKSAQGERSGLSIQNA